MIYLGIDPGQSGSISGINAAGEVVGWIKLDETHRDIDDWLKFAIKDGAKAIMEKVGTTPQMGVKSAGTFMESKGILIGLLIANRISHEFVAPSKWQKEMDCRTGGDKNISKAAAQRLWPDTKITHANADALLLAEFCRRKHQSTTLPVMGEAR